MQYFAFFHISGAGFAVCLTVCNQKGRCLKRGKHYGEYTVMVFKLYAASASTVHFKVIFKPTLCTKQWTTVKNGEKTISVKK